MRVLVSRSFVGDLQYVEIAGTSEEAQALPTSGFVTGSRFTCVDNGCLYLFDEAANNWNGPFKLYESVANSN